MSARLVADTIRTVGSEIQEILFPSHLYCICCGNIVDNTRSYSICDHCMTHIRWDIAPAKDRGDIRLLSATSYGIYERSIIFALKYDGHKYIAGFIGEIMRDRLKAEGVELTDNHIIVPVPLHRDKFLERGFNQSELIAKSLSKKTGVPVLDALRRIKYTRPMRGLGPEERLMNIRGAMEVKPEYRDLIANKSVILVEINRRLLIPKSERLKPLISRGFMNRKVSISESKASNNALFQKIA